MKEKATGKSGKGSHRSSPSKPLSSSSSSRVSGSGTNQDSDSLVSALPGLTRKTRPELVALAESLGLTVAPEDRRIDLIERIRAGLTHPHPGEGSEKRKGEKGTTHRLVEEPPLSPIIEVPRPESHLDTLPPLHSSVRKAGGWKDFQDIPYEPSRRERGHYVTVLPLSPFRIMAFFGIDREIDAGLAGRIDSAGLVLKVRDVTGAVTRKEIGPDPMTDHVFDILTGRADRWNIPLWSSHRWMEAWLGFYDNGTFHVLARSKRIRTPRGGPSPRTGTLFHLKETAFTPFSPMEDHGRDSIPRYHIKLPTSNEIPASLRKP